MFTPTPFQRWEEDITKDYRTNPTQVESYVRNILNEDRFLLDTHRVNSGKNFVTRAMQADNTPPQAADIINPKHWGHSTWLNNRDFKSATKAENLYSDQSPYSPYNPKSSGGCSSCRRRRF